MKFVYMATAGPSSPTNVSVPFHLAVNGSVEQGHDTTIIIGGDATDMLVGDAVEKIEGVGLPPLRELLEKARDRATIYI